MGQITEGFAQTMLENCNQGQHPALTVWEAKQLAWAWLELKELRNLRPIAYLFHDAYGSLKLSQTVPPPFGAFPVYAEPKPGDAA